MTSAGDRVPHVLLTNDDGYDREGLRALRDALIEAGARVTVVAPADNRSGLARAVTCRGGTEVVLISADGAGNRVFSCTGTPVDSVRVGLLSGIVGEVDAVAAGINHGVNLGDDSTYSGTVGAAFEGALLDVPSIALSQQDDAGDLSMLSHGRHSFGLANFAAQAVLAVLQEPPPDRIVLSLNLPYGVTSPRVMAARCSRFAYEAGWTTPEPIGRDRWQVWPYAKPGGPDPDVERGDGTDYATVAAGAVSATALHADWGAFEVPPARTRGWLDGIVARLNLAMDSLPN